MNRTGLIRNVGRACETTWDHQLTSDLGEPCLSWLILAADQAIKKMDPDALIELAYPRERGKLPADDAQDIRRLFIPGRPACAILLANATRAVSIPLAWTDVGLTFCASSISDEVVVALNAKNAREHLNSFIVDVCVAFFSKRARTKPAEARSDFREMREVAG